MQLGIGDHFCQISIERNHYLGQFHIGSDLVFDKFCQFRDNLIQFKGIVAKLLGTDMEQLGKHGRVKPYTDIIESIGQWKLGIFLTKSHDKTLPRLCHVKKNVDAPIGDHSIGELLPQGPDRPKLPKTIYHVT